MKSTTLPFFLLTFLISGCVTSRYKQHISLQPTSQTIQESQVSNVLLIGTGSVGSRIFLDNLSDEMMKIFRQKGVGADYSYMGKTAQSTALNFDKAKSDKYDSYLVFKAANESYLDMTKEKYKIIGVRKSLATRYGNQYVETFSVTMYKGKGKQEVMWQGDLLVDVDIADRAKYQKISKLFFHEFTKSRILPK